VPVFTYHFLRSAPPHTDPANPPYCSVNNSVCHGTIVVCVCVCVSCVSCRVVSCC
jgi:hypothetical protein